MLRFNNVVQVQCYNIPTFQYILCYGSTENRISGIPLPDEFQYILCYGSTLRYLINNNFFGQFQYILCYGSTV